MPATSLQTRSHASLQTRSHPRLGGRLHALVLAVLTLLSLVVLAGPASAEPTSEQRMVERLNAERTSRGLGALVQVQDLTAVAQRHSDRMAAENRLHHNPALATDVVSWAALAENVGYGGSADTVHNALMASEGHRINILNPTYTQIGMGTTVVGGRVWVTQVFRKPTAAAATAPAVSTAAPAPAPAPATSPIGALDIVRRVPAGLELRGWSIDPDAVGARGVHVYVNGRPAGATTAGLPRPDVGRAFPAHGPDHGYAVVVPAGVGPQQVCAYGINAGAGSNSLLGCRTIDSRVSPFGAMDTATPVPGGLRLRGWALDPDSAASLVVHLWVDGRSVAAFNAQFDRPDVGAAFPGYGSARAFDVVVPMPPGARQACSYGINVGPGDNGLLACRAVG